MRSPHVSPELVLGGRGCNVERCVYIRGAYICLFSIVIYVVIIGVVITKVIIAI